jgi:hypothetical protein
MADPITLENLAKEIRDCWHQADETRLKIGRMLLDARQRVHAGEAGKITWEKWVERNIKRSMRDVQRCIALVEGKTDKEALAALNAERTKAAAGMRQTRERQRTQATNVSRAAEHDTAAPPEQHHPLSLEQIEEAVKRLSPEDLRVFCDWLREYEAERRAGQTGGDTEAETAAELQPVSP